MSTQDYEENCKGCKISQGKKMPLGDILIKLDCHWVLNHYGGDEGFLGWLALQPKKHRMNFSELTCKELSTLGPNIKHIDEALCKYWSTKFPDDPVERVYVVYFFESAFSRKADFYHMHIHLIPRTRKIGGGIPWERAAWETSKLTKQGWFPPEYQIKDRTSVDRVRDLMTCLNESLGKPQCS